MIAAKNLSKIGRPGEDFTGRVYGTMEVLWRARERGSGPERPLYPVAMPVPGMRGRADMHIQQPEKGHRPLPLPEAKEAGSP